MARLAPAPIPAATPAATSGSTPDLTRKHLSRLQEHQSERDYDDELITEDEIRAMIDEKIHEEATDDDIARIAHLLEEAGVNVDPHVPGATH